ncbi:MAG: di-trans,poly-cis-decaprenylcistransferase [Rhodospirillaceae bacterium]|nr:di-trans,poly-cis-decaprenylcistransferase [Rhodospirillaceae bacterium]
MTSAPSLPETISSPPIHVGIIMDGNGRWAEERGWPRVEGHRRGIEAVRQVVKCSIQSGIKYLTLYGFSIENWKRPSQEIEFLMGLFRLYLREELDELDEGGVRLRFIGYRGLLDKDIVTLIEEAEDRTKGNKVLTVIVAFSYGARQEITSAVRDVARQVLAGDLDIDQIDEIMFSEHLETAGIPDPDLVIRTSGEHRISNFLLWQSAYSEFLFTDTLWPEFCEEEFQGAINEYKRRERRYGDIV